MTAILLDNLKELAYPEPEGIEKSADKYLEKVIFDESIPFEVRMNAKYDHTILHSLNQQREQGFQQFLQLSIAFDDAMEQYKNLFPAKATTS